MNTNTLTTADLSNLSLEQIEAIAAKKREENAKAAAQEKQKYENERDAAIEQIFAKATQLHNDLKVFKSLVADAMEIQSIKLEEYGKMNKKSKGGFTVKHSQNHISITRRRDTEPQWDERSSKALELLKDFLTDTIKKRDTKQYEILMTFLQRNQNGDLEYSRVMDLLQHKDKYNDPRWLEGLRLIQDSYSNKLKAFGYEIKQKPADGKKWEMLNLNFSSL